MRSKGIYLSDMREGLRLRCVGDYADCIHKGREYEIKKEAETNILYLECDTGHHNIEVDWAYRGSSGKAKPHFPEFEAVEIKEAVTN
jgi:hypothetical protein